MRPLLPFACLVLAVGFAACAPAETPTPAEPLTVADSIETLEASERTTTNANDSTDWTLDDTRMDRLRQQGSTLLSIRTAAHDDGSPEDIGYDRVVFSFDTLVPGYRIAYVDTSAYHCGSGEPVTVAGDGWLEIEFFPAAAHTDDTWEATIPEQRISYTLPTLREALSTCDFEGYVTWVLGLDKATPYRVLEVTDPARLVVDVQHER